MPNHFKLLITDFNRACSTALTYCHSSVLYLFSHSARWPYHTSSNSSYTQCHLLPLSQLCHCLILCRECRDFSQALLHYYTCHLQSCLAHTCKLCLPPVVFVLSTSIKNHSSLLMSWVLLPPSEEICSCIYTGLLLSLLLHHALPPP